MRIPRSPGYRPAKRGSSSTRGAEMSFVGGAIKSVLFTLSVRAGGPESHCQRSVAAHQDRLPARAPAAETRPSSERHARERKAQSGSTRAWEGLLP